MKEPTRGERSTGRRVRSKLIVMPSRPSLHETDFYAWSQEQAALLRAGRIDETDPATIAEEIESMGKTEKRELVSRLSVLLLRLLKWRNLTESHFVSGGRVNPSPVDVGCGSGIRLRRVGARVAR